MSPPTESAVTRRIHFSAESGIAVQTTDHLIRDTNLLLSRAGLGIRPSKVSRLVRAWRGTLTVSGDGFIDYLASRLKLTVQQRVIVADQYRHVIAYADPTGETAVQNVMGRGLLR